MKDLNLMKLLMQMFTLLVVCMIIILGASITIFIVINLFKETKKIENKPIINAIDTVISEEPKFFSQTPQEGLEEALVYYKLEHKEIVLAQAILETGHFTSDVCVKYNNLFGLYNSKEKQYYRFAHWSESVIAYKEWIQRRYQSPDNYYTFLKELNYAEDKNYTKTLKEIVNKIKYDKRRYIKRDSFT